jgi:hypothetical protein
MIDYRFDELDDTGKFANREPEGREIMSEVA